MDRMVTLRMVAHSIDFEPLRHDVCIDVVLRGSDTEEGKEAMELVRGKLMAAIDIDLGIGGQWVNQGTLQEGGKFSVTTLVDKDIR